MDTLRTIFYNSEPRLRTGWRILGNLLLLIVFILLLNLLLFLLPLILRKFSLVISAWLTMIAITMAVYFSRRWFDRRSFVSLGLFWNSRAVQDLFVGLGIAALIMTIIFSTEWALGWIGVDGVLWQRKLWSAVLVDLILWLLFYIAIGWYEELLNRGYWLQNIADGLNLFWGVLISSVVFGLSHLFNANISPIAILWLMVISLFLAYGYLATHALWLPIGLHIGWNFFQGPVFGFPVSGTTSNGLIIQKHITGHSLLTGGTFGPEAGLILLVGLIVGTGLIWGYTHQRSVIVGSCCC